jgi:hypothetical protein
MSLALDHLVVAARTLEEGARWLEARMGVPTVAGGRHAAMGTHNRLLALGEGAYLGLDSPAMARRLAAGPALVHWVARTDDLDGARAAEPALVGEILALSRGDYRWRIGVPADGALPAAGAFPTLIQWEGDRHPAAALPASGCRLERLTVRTPRARDLARRLAALGASDAAAVCFEAGDGSGTGLSAILLSPRGVVILPESAVE